MGLLSNLCFSLPNVSSTKLFPTHRAHKRFQVRVAGYVRLQSIIPVKHLLTHIALIRLLPGVNNPLVVAHRARGGKHLLAFYTGSKDGVIKAGIFTVGGKFTFLPIVVSLVIFLK